jgi:hypothetical protein
MPAGKPRRRSGCANPGANAGALGIVIVAPGFERGTGMRQRTEQRLVQELVAEPAIEALDERVLGRFAWRYVVPADAALVGPVQMALEVSSVPLSETIVAGFARLAMIRSSSRATLRPGIEVSATSARHSRVQSSTTARIRKRRPSTI